MPRPLRERSSWKWKPKAASGLASDSNSGSRKKPTATARFFPLSGRRLIHRAAAGVIELQVLYGQDPTDQHWGCPLREDWGLTSHQQLSLALEDKLAFTITATASYEQAAAVAQKWGVPTTDSSLQALTQQLGARAQGSFQKQLAMPRRNESPNAPPHCWPC